MDVAACFCQQHAAANQDNRIHYAIWCRLKCEFEYEQLKEQALNLLDLFLRTVDVIAHLLHPGESCFLSKHYSACIAAKN